MSKRRRDKRLDRLKKCSYCGTSELLIRFRNKSNQPRGCCENQACIDRADREWLLRIEAEHRDRDNLDYRELVSYVRDKVDKVVVSRSPICPRARPIRP